MDSEDLTDVIYELMPTQGIVAPIWSVGSLRMMRRSHSQSMRQRRRRAAKPLCRSGWYKPVQHQWHTEVLHEWIVDARA